MGKWVVDFLLASLHLSPWPSSYLIFEGPLAVQQSVARLNRAFIPNAIPCLYAKFGTSVVR